MKLAYETILLLFLLSLTTLPVSARVKEWKQVPLCTTTQKAAGLTGGEGMQMIKGIAYASSNPRVVYMVSDTSQVWKSIDGGNSWKMKHKGFYANGGLSVAVDPHDENIVLVAGFAGPKKEKNDNTLATGIFRTTDGGENWNLVKRIDYFSYLTGQYFAFDSTSFDGIKTRIVYAGTYRDGLLKSTDGGDNWTNIGLKKIKISDIRIAPKKTLLLYLATEEGLYRYNDEKGEISKIGLGLPDFPRNIVINPVKNNIIYATVGKHGVYKSTDSGNHFESQNNGLWIAGKEYMHLSLSPANPEHLYVSVNEWGGSNPYWSHDGGERWHQPKTRDKEGLTLAGGGRFYSRPIEPHPKIPGMALTGSADVLKTEDGGINWFYSGNGYTGGRMSVGKSSLAFFNDSKKMICFLLDFGPASTEDGGDTWRLLPVPRIFGCKSTPVGAVDPTGKSKTVVTAVGAWSRQLLTVSDDEGETWRVIPGTEDNYRFIGFHPQKPDIIYAQGWKSEDRGTTWKKLSKKVWAIYQKNGDIVYSIDSLESIYPIVLKSLQKNSSVVLKSVDGGKTWDNPFDWLPIPAGSITEIDVDPHNPNCIYVASSRGLYIYNDGHWIKKGDDSGLSKDRFGWLFFKCVAIDPRHPEVVYTGRWAPGKGHSNGIFRSTDFGRTWENITYNLGSEITCWSISVSPHDGTVYFGSSHGTWTLAPPY